MHLPDLGRWLRANGGHQMPRRVEPARVDGFQLVWDYHSRSRDGGAANVEPHAGAEVRGLALEVDDALLRMIDRKEGHPRRYDRGTAPVTATLLVSDERIDAWLYRVTPAFRTGTFVAPRTAYMRLMLDAAREHALGEDWLAGLRSVPTAD